MEFIWEFLFGSRDVIQAIGPLALAGIGMGVSALGGLLSNRNNKRTTVDIPPEIQEQIDQLENRQFFMPAIQRALGGNQGAFNIRSNLAAQGIDSPAITAELMEDMQRDRSDQAVGVMQQLEGLRLNALQNSIGQLSNLNAQNAQFQQQQTDNRLGIINSATSGIGSSFIQGLGAKIRQDNFNRFMDMRGPTGQQGGQGFGMMDQFDAGQLDNGIFGGFGGGINSNSFT